MSGADKDDESGSQALSAAMLHGTQPSGRSEKVKLEPEAQEDQSQYQHHEQNRPMAHNLPKAEEEQKRDPRESAEDQARLETNRSRNQKKRLRRRRRQNCRKWGISMAEIKALQAQVKVAEEEREKAQTNMSALEESSEEIRNQLHQTEENLHMAMNAGRDLEGRLEAAVATFDQEREHFNATVAGYNETQGRLLAALNQERKRYGELVAHYDKISDRLGENVVALSRERELREVAEKRNSQWKKDYNELAERMTTERQGTHDKLTDEYLIDEVQKLDFNIRKFAQMYFGDADPQSAAFNFSVTVPTSDADIDHIYVLRTLPGQCARVAQARLWSILVHTVLGRYVWCLDRKESLLGRAIVRAETCEFVQW